MKLLLAEDDRIVRITVRDALEDAGYDVTACADGAAAAAALEREPFDIFLTDVRLPGEDGLNLFRRARRVQPEAGVVLMTAFADAEDAVAVMREGARDYLQKPFEIEELLLRIGRVRDESRVPPRDAGRGGAEVLDGRFREARPPCAACSIASRPLPRATSRSSSRARREPGRISARRTIHERSRRAGKPFVVVNCAAIPEALLESELFGHEKGAFTGADRRRVGRFEAADGGTLFLDEVGELAPGSQAKLLRAIETSTFEPVGASRSVHVDVRVVAATNRDLGAEIARGAFRKDLYYRLNVIDIETPPLARAPVGHPRARLGVPRRDRCAAGTGDSRGSTLRSPRRWARMTTPATSASCSTRSSAPSRSRAAAPSASSTCRRTWSRLARLRT